MVFESTRAGMYFFESSVELLAAESPRERILLACSFCIADWRRLYGLPAQLSLSEIHDPS